MDKRLYYPTTQEIRVVIKAHPHRCMAELTRILGVDRPFLQNLINELNLKLPNHRGKNCA